MIVVQFQMNQQTGSLILIVSVLVIAVIIWFIIKKLIHSNSTRRVDLPESINEDLFKILKLISDELSESLTQVKLPSGTLKKIIHSSGSPPVIDAQFDLIEQNIGNLERLIDNLVGLSRLNKFQIDRDFRPIDIRLELYEMWDKYKNDTSHLNLHYQLQITELPPSFLLLDINKLSITLDNLLNFAIVKTESDGEVTMEALREDNKLVIKIDGKKGDSYPSDLLEITEQQSATFSTKHNLNLILADMFARLLKGKLIKDFKANVAFSFRLELPYNEAKSNQRPEGFPENDFSIKESSPLIFNNKLSPPSKPVILIVGESHEVEMSLKKNYKVLRTKNGFEALAVLKRDNIDLVISEITISDFDGFTLIDKFRQNEHTRFLPAIIIKNKEETIDRLKFLSHGLDDYLTHPIATKELTTLVERMLERSRVRRSFQEEAQPSIRQTLGIN